MPQTYASRLSRTSAGKRLYGRAKRYDRQDLRLPAVIALAVDTDTGAAPLAVTFDDTTSFVESGDAREPSVISYDFGDGTAVTEGSNPTHNYTVAGTYTATVFATDRAGHVVSDSVLITVTA